MGNSHQTSSQPPDGEQEDSWFRCDEEKQSYEKVLSSFVSFEALHRIVEKLNEFGITVACITNELEKDTYWYHNTRKTRSFANPGMNFPYCFVLPSTPEEVAKAVQIIYAERMICFDQDNFPKLSVIGGG